MGRCWEDAGEQERGPVSLGINLAAGSTNRLSPPISHRHTDGYLYCQVAAVAACSGGGGGGGAGEERRQFKEAEKGIGTPAKQNATRRNTLRVLAASEAPIHEEAKSGGSCQRCRVKCLIVSADISSQMKIKLVFPASEGDWNPHLYFKNLTASHF